MPTNKEIMEFKKVTQPYIDAYNRIKEREYKRCNGKETKCENLLYPVKS